MVLLCGLGAACSDAAGSGELNADAQPRLVITEVQRVGDADDPDVGFSRVFFADVDRDGQLYVFESQDMQIRVYDTAGRLVSRIGRSGEGPGEFSSPSRFGVVGDTVWVVEAFSRRLHLFNRAGAILSTTLFQPVQVGLHNDLMGDVMPNRMREDGRFVGDLMMFRASRDMPASGVGPNDTVRVPRVLFDATGAVLDTVGWDLRAPPPDGSFDLFQVGSQRYRTPSPPSDQRVSIPLADGRIFVDPAHATSADVAIFSVTRVALTGDTVYRREYHYEPVRYPAAVLDTFAWRSARTPGGFTVPGVAPAMQDAADAKAAYDAIRSRMSFPEFQPPVQQSVVGADGGLLLRREEDGAPTYRWLVLDANGMPRGEIELPRQARVGWSRGDDLWVIEPDEFDVPWLVRYRVTPS
jgi:hypothetical protein